MYLRIALVTAAVLFAGVTHAEAKVVNMGILSRAEVKSACERAGGRLYGVERLNDGYGCSSDVADVACTPDGLCRASIGDTQPLTGNSLDYVLTYGRAIPPSEKILRQNRRIEAVNAPRTPVTSTGCYGLAYQSPGCAGEPPPQ